MFLMYFILSFTRSLITVVENLTKCTLTFLEVQVVIFMWKLVDLQGLG